MPQPRDGSEPQVRAVQQQLRWSAQALHEA